MGKESAVIIYRHACDGGYNEEGPRYYSPNVNIKHESKEVDKIKVGRSRLSKDDNKRAQALAYHLNQWINQNYQPVSRVITEGPGSGDLGTPNPLLTVDPLVRYLSADTSGLPDGELKLRLFDKKTYQDNEKHFNPNALLKDGNGKYSTVMCWETYGLWRLEKGTKYQKDQILGLLSRNPETPLLSKGENYPRKCQTIYVFTNLQNDKFDLTIFSFDEKRKIFKVEGEKLPPPPC